MQKKHVFVAELKALLANLHLPVSFGTYLMDKLDVDKNGVLNYRDFQEYFGASVYFCPVEFFLGACSNWLKIMVGGLFSHTTFAKTGNIFTTSWRSHFSQFSMGKNKH